MVLDGCLVSAKKQHNQSTYYMIFSGYFPNIYFLIAIQLFLSGSAHVQRRVENPIKRMGWNFC